MKLSDLSPIEKRGDLFIKREDLFEREGIAGGKVRQALALCVERNPKGLVGYGSRNSNTAAALAAIAKLRALPCAFYTATGPLTPYLTAAGALGAQVVQVDYGYQSHLKHRAKLYATQYQYLCGLQYPPCISIIVQQMDNVLRLRPKRIVVAIGSGLTLAGILNAIDGITIPVLGVIVGGKPDDVLDLYAPGWQSEVEIVNSKGKYQQPAKATYLEDLELDPFYEAKCIPFLRDGDLLWNASVTGNKGDTK